MPVTENGFEYEMPQIIKEIIDRDFLIVFRDELYKISNFSLSDFAYESALGEGGTGGWYVAFGLACIRSNKDELFKYRNSLPWYESDMFDSDVGELMCEHNLVLKGTIDDLIIKELGLNYFEFDVCAYCGKRFLTKNMIKEDGYHVCDKCRLKEDNPNCPQYYKDGIKIVEEYYGK